MYIIFAEYIHMIEYEKNYFREEGCFFSPLEKPDHEVRTKGKMLLTFLPAAGLHCYTGYILLPGTETEEETRPALTQDTLPVYC